MSLWLLFTLLAVWIGLCLTVVALCVMAARGNGRDDARRVAAGVDAAPDRQPAPGPVRLHVARRRQRRAIAANPAVQRGASG